MTDNSKGLLIGGVMPAIMLGMFSTFQKVGARTGVGPEMYILIGGIVIAIVGCVIMYFNKSPELKSRGIIWAILSGSCWAVATACVSYAVMHYNTPMSILAPIFNTNTLTTVILSMLILGEWRELKVTRVFIGAIMIIAGALIVSQG